MKTKNMVEGNPMSLIFFFSLPLMFGNLFQQLYTVMDTIIVSQKLGTSALAAIGSVDWINWLGFGVVTGFAQGFAIRVAQAFGNGKQEKLNDAISSMLVSCLLVAVVSVIFSVPFLSWILKVMHTPQDVYSMASTYVHIIYLGLPVTMFYNCYAGILRSLGNSKAPLNAMILASLLNIGLDVLFVMGLNGGVGSAALATLIAQLFAGVYCWFVFRSIKEISVSSVCTNKEDYVENIKLGAPMALQNTLISIGGMVLTSVVNQFGTNFLAGFTAVNKLYGLLEVAAVSYGYAMVTYTGQNYGAGKIERIKKGVRAGFLISVLTSLLVGFILLIFGQQILTFFIKENEEALQVGWTFLRIMAICLPILYLLHMYRSVIQGLSDTFIPMISGIFELIFRIGIAMFLPLWFGQAGLYPVEVGAWIGADLILIPSYYRKIRKAS